MSMDDPILRRLADMRQAQHPSVKVTLPPINHVTPDARVTPVAETGFNGEPSSSSPHVGVPLEPSLGQYRPTVAASSSSLARERSVSPPHARAVARTDVTADKTLPERTLHAPLKPKGRAYSSAAAGGAQGPQLLASLARRRHSSGTQAPVAPVTLAAAKSASAKTRSKSTSLSARAKQRAQSFTYGEPGAASSTAAAGKPLNTHSPIAVAAAAAVTSEKISKLLATQGPLPIRHITSHLSATIPGFGELSLSKQRRLIIAVLDGPRSDFVKVGWGRWAVRGHTTDSASHRESISAQLPNSKPPLSPGLRAIEDSAVFSDSDSDSDIESEAGDEGLDDVKLGGRFEDDEVEGTDEEDWRSMGPASLRQTSPREQDAIAALVQLRSV